MMTDFIMVIICVGLYILGVKACRDVLKKYGAYEMIDVVVCLAPFVHWAIYICEVSDNWDGWEKIAKKFFGDDE